MPVPKRQHSKSRTGKRSAGKHKVIRTPGICNVCNAFVERHAVCLGCGFYKGMKVLRAKSERSEERSLVKKIRERSLAEVDAKRKLLAERQAKEAAGSVKKD